jgi:EAL domain-containing protein (putative c-di-GMP-specific phosphodiesterase class I)
MTYLKVLPVDEIEIDRSFVTQLATDRVDHALVRSTIEVGHSLGLIVVAEGVEDAAALAELGRLGCDVAQGYYFARPLPPGEFSDWYRARTTSAVALVGTSLVCEPGPA